MTWIYGTERRRELLRRGGEIDVWEVRGGGSC